MLVAWLLLGPPLAFALLFGMQWAESRLERAQRAELAADAARAEGTGR